MSNLSLEASIKTCKVDTAWANRAESDRFLNPALMTCPIFNGYDSAGRPVCPDSFYTKSAGCNSAEDRVLVENGLRPQYAEYINLSANGYGSSIYNNTMAWENQNLTNTDMSEVRTSPGYGNAGYDMMANTLSNCKYNQYERAMNQQYCPKPLPCDPCNRGGAAGAQPMPMPSPPPTPGNNAVTTLPWRIPPTSNGTIVAATVTPSSLPWNASTVKVYKAPYGVKQSAQASSANRQIQSMQQGYYSNQKRAMSGF